MEILRKKEYSIHMENDPFGKKIISVKKQTKSLPFFLKIGRIVNELQCYGKWFQFLEKEEFEDVLSYCQGLDNPLFIGITGTDDEKKEMELFLKEKNYIETNDIEKIKKYDEEIDNECNMITEKDQQRIENKLRIYDAFEKTLKKWHEKELLIYCHRYISSQSFHVCINGISTDIYLIDDSKKIVIKINEEKTLKTVKTPKEVENYLEKWIEGMLKKQRLRTLISPSKLFFKSWMNKKENLYNRQEEFYHILSAHFSPLEIEEIAATYLKNEKVHEKMDMNHDIVYFKEKIIVITMCPFEVSVFQNDKQLKENVVSCLTKQLTQTVDKFFEKKEG